ncbi:MULTISPECIES: deoxyribodipyrimidine photo-lyase [Pseudomonas]|uniref:Deoxyribodipyrimidine photo-lyase n=1 Tax=Pseudomonas sp. Hg7Tf TaxID=3236988 RepID=A0AB39HW52_9PSED|nr:MULTISPECIES: deoxyribodipyrimidine photo-lyase [Pseudomonas]KJK06003.1 deoxyribodipyrimidine photolyase [Pseudomonas sp. 5]MDD1978257.1 deoxyribodipyrimidine photo-lyase [Pseudomonas putida]MDH2559937.1 deoxyribodipyrimidine photo-lyase [Pseudomonas sp. Hg5Tf]QYX45719.1 deoxyribodipyrimidine photo-lyase [Pseudomonas sp. S11A 273]
MQLIWLRSDLRVHDNTALSAACTQGPTLAVWLISAQQWHSHDDAPCKIDFWLRNLRVLREQLGALNIPLLVREADTWDKAPDVLLQICREHQVQALHLNEEYGVNESRRDQAVRQTLTQAGIAVQCYLDQLLFRPGSILTRSGGYFQVFSQFRKACYQRLHMSVPNLQCLPTPQAPLAIASDTIPAQVAGFEPPASSLSELWPAGETEAETRLQRFIDESVEDYQQQRDFPAVTGTSQLSPYLAAGVISPRQCLHRALAHNLGEFDSGNQGLVTWINELLWREFYKHILHGYPRVSRHRAFRQETEALPWRHAPEELKAWQEGRTGIPIIDAAMRQLLATGWMHNRLRMVVAMFLTKNLLIDWREGERFFMRHLIDGDLAANNGGWQWSASTGTDAVPYFRIFNPVSQSRRFDSQGFFIRRWLPERVDVDDKNIHLPMLFDGLFATTQYPLPIVDLASSRQRALVAFKNLSTRQFEESHLE